MKTPIKKISKKSLFILIGLSVVLVIGIIVFVTVNFILSNTGTSIESEDGLKSLIVTQDELSTIQIVKNSEDSVVSIAVSSTVLTREQGFVDETNNIGTGFIVDKNGLIITNQHVVSDLDSEYQVVTNDGTKYDVLEIKRDNINDIALIKIEAENLKPLTMGDSDILEVGQKVLAIGTPLGEYTGSVTEGIVSGLNRSVTTSSDWFGTTTKTYENVIQTDAAVNPGNSGGPLIDSQGSVIGINFATTSGADNISFAIPIDKVKERVQEYITYGKFIMPYLGVSYNMIYGYQLVYYNNLVAGAGVVNIDTSGPAYKAGIRRGDIITEFGDEKVEQALSYYIQKHKVGDKVSVQVYRDKETKTFTVTLGEME
ncbi:MAG: trypsin-like peptidase domain-containing protein [Candidatus Dojkabacteria bacterium]|nr:trypsin-like peptidase domain-containing protein [Candidatus Dojkabacteria bacterium]